MNKFNKYALIICVAALGSACKSGGGGSTNAESLSSEGQEKLRSSTRTSTYRNRNVSRSSSQTPAPAPKETPSPRPTPVEQPQPEPTPIVTRPEPRPAPQPEPIAEVPAPAPAPAPEPEPEPAPEPAPIVVGNAKLSWTIPNKRENGDALAPSELSHYEVYYTSESGKSDTIKINDTSRTALTVRDLEGDTYYFAMAAVDKDGIFSELSNEVPKTIK